MAERLVLGVDGCPGGGWVGALVAVSAGRARLAGWLLLPDAAAIGAVDADATAVDIPVGLPDAGPRRCDVEARRLLGPRRASVFPAPVRATLAAASYAEACALSRAASGRALSRQTWHLLPRIADVDRQATAATQARVVECHPELAFARLTGAPLPGKKTLAGHAARLAALAPWLPGAAEAVAGAPRPARRDDAADALACAWSAARWAAGAAVVLPAVTERDARGLRMQIVS